MNKERKKTGRDNVGGLSVAAARFYWLTALGCKQLATEVSQFERVMGAIQRMRQTT